MDNYTNGTCTSVSSLTLTVNTPASISTQPINQTLCTGSSTTISVSATGTSLNYQWQINTGSGWTDITNGGVYSNATTATLSISDVTGLSGYQYRVNITPASPCILITSNVATLTITPLHTISLTSATGTNGQTLCNNTTLTNITYSVGGGATGASVSGLPSGVTGNYNSGVFTISGTPTVAGSYSYTVTTTANACSSVTATGSITVNTETLLDWVNLQWPPSGTICSNGTYTAYGQVYKSGVTEAGGAGSGIVAQLGYGATGTNPNTWTNWQSATFNVQSGNNDEYMATLSSLIGGSKDYTFRYSLNGCSWQYGGYSGGGGSFWDGSTYVSGGLTVNQKGEWTGASNTSWSNSANWKCSVVPSGSDSISIPITGNHPVLSANTTIDGSLTITDILSIGGHVLTLNGIVTGSGKLVGSSISSLIIGGTGSLGTINFDQTTDGTTNTLASLTLNRTSSGSATLGNKLVLIDALTPTAGTLNTGGYLHLRSRSTNTARIAAGATSGGYINGDVTVERYMSSANSGVSNRAYRLITPSVTTSNYIRDNWQEGTNNPDVSTNNNPVSHYGTHITGLSGNSAGFDVTQNNSNSLFNYNQTTNAWDAVTNTNATILDAKKGYLIFIRGSRNSLSTINTTTGYTDSLILRAKGSIAQGDQTFVLTGVSGDFALVTNPYPAPINWASVYTTNSSNFNNYVTIWDPNQGSRGGYVTVTSGGVTTPGTSALTTNIQTGQAFFVQLNASAPTLNINEAHKSTTNNLNVYRTTANAERLNINLKYTASGAERNADGVTALIDNSYNNAVDGDDAEQIQNWDEDVALLRGNKELSIESRNNANTTDTLFLQTLRLRAAQANYKWEIEPLNIATITEASLIDNFTNTVTPLSLTNNTITNFTVSSNTASLAANRFKIVFKTNASLPVTVTKFTAQLKNNTVQLNWNTANEQNINNYEVERSVDGRTFSSIATIRASNNSSYNTIDNNPQYGINYYRLKVNEQNGKVNYSNIIQIQVGKQVSTLVTVYPNPIINNVLSVQLVNAAKGSYSLSLYNIAGQKVYEKTLEHQGGSSTENLAIGSLLSQGQYQLRIIGNNGYLNTETIIKQ